MNTWHLDEVFIKIQGERQYLWRAVDQDGDVIDILVQPRRDQKAAKRFFRKLLKGQGRPPWRLVTDKLRSYSAAHREVMPSAVHHTDRYRNNLVLCQNYTDMLPEQVRQQVRRHATAFVRYRDRNVHAIPHRVHPDGRRLGRVPGCVREKVVQVPFYQDKQKTPLHILIDSSGLAVHAGQLRRAQKSRDYRKLHLCVDASEEG